RECAPVAELAEAHTEQYESFNLTTHRLPVTDYRLPLTAYRLPANDHRSPITDSRSVSIFPDKDRRRFTRDLLDSLRKRIAVVESTLKGKRFERNSLNIFVPDSLQTMFYPVLIQQIIERNLQLTIQLVRQLVWGNAKVMRHIRQCIFLFQEYLLLLHQFCNISSKVEDPGSRAVLMIVGWQIGRRYIIRFKAV